MKTADIVIIGGGIVGISIAYQLALRSHGSHNIVVLEQDSVASGSTGRATGGIRQQFTDELDIRFSIEGVRFYKQFTSVRDTASNATRLHFYQHGYLFLVTTPASWQNMQQHVALQQALGVPTQLLTPAEVRQRVPQLLVDDILGATFCPEDGYSDPAAMTRALAQEARAQGVIIYEHTSVIDIGIAHNRVQTVKTPQESFSTPLVVNAAGAYAALIARMAGITDLPVYPLRRQLYLTEPFVDLPYDIPMIVELHTGFHFRRREDCIILTLPLSISQEEEQRNRRLEPEAFTFPVDEQQWHNITEVIQRRCPALLQARVARCWSGLYEMTPDEHPVLGTTEVVGFLCACGFSGHGFMHAPMTAKLMTNFILDGDATPIQAFNIERFRKGQPFKTAHLL